MRSIIAGLLCASATIGAAPSTAQGLIEPDWEVTKNNGSCVVIGHLPAGSTVTHLRFAIPFDERAIHGISVFVGEDATEAPAEAMLGVNGNAPLNVGLKWTGGIGAPNAFIAFDEREELGEELRTGTPAVLRVGGEVISLQAVSGHIAEGRECVRTIFADAGIELDDYPGVREPTRIDPNELRRKFRLGRHSAKLENSVLGLFNAGDYPSAAIINGEQGAVRAALMIDAKGKVEDCVVLVSAGERLDDATCKILKSRGRFTPTIDDDGQSISSIFVTPSIRWSLPYRKK